MMANQPTSQNKNKVWILSGVALIVLILVFGFGLAAGRVSWGVQDRMGFRAMDERGGMMGGWTRGGLNANEDRLSGVVTAVNGSSFTMAGSGVTNTVTTNSSTQWQGGDSVKVNDSVLVFGTTSNGTFTATHVLVNP